jgi:hypothetical protein
MGPTLILVSTKFAEGAVTDDRQTCGHQNFSQSTIKKLASDIQAEKMPVDD